MNRGKRLRAYRRQQGITQTVLAERMGFANSSPLQKREAGTRPTSRAEYSRAIAIIDEIVEARDLDSADLLAEAE